MPPSSGLKADQPWPVDVTVLQHGETPLAGSRPSSASATTAARLSTPSPPRRPGGPAYHAAVRFLGEGRYSYEVYDGFTAYGGARTHTFKPVAIGAPGGSFPYAIVGLALALALGLAVAATLYWRRGQEPAPVTNLRRPPKKLFVFVATVVAALAVTGAANAGCMATVGLSSLPKPGLQAGQPWVVTIRVLQHGRTPMRRTAKPEVRIRNAAGKLFVFKAKQTGVIGLTGRGSSS